MGILFYFIFNLELEPYTSIRGSEDGEQDAINI